MKCYASPLDVCHNLIRCQAAGRCIYDIYENELNKKSLGGDPLFHATLDRMKEIHEAKSHDYADKANSLSNFDVSTYMISQFKNDRDKSFVWPIATKLARLSTLLNSQEKPKNESIEDSMVDIANYLILWKVDYERRNKP